MLASPRPQAGTVQRRSGTSQLLDASCRGRKPGRPACRQAQQLPPLTSHRPAAHRYLHSLTPVTPQSLPAPPAPGLGPPHSPPRSLAAQVQNRHQSLGRGFQLCRSETPAQGWLGAQDPPRAVHLPQPWATAAAPVHEGSVQRRASPPTARAACSCSGPWIWLCFLSLASDTLHAAPPAWLCTPTAHPLTGLTTVHMPGEGGEGYVATGGPRAPASCRWAVSPYHTPCALQAPSPTHHTCRRLPPVRRPRTPT